MSELQTRKKSEFLFGNNFNDDKFRIRIYQISPKNARNRSNEFPGAWYWTPKIPTTSRAPPTATLPAHFNSTCSVSSFSQACFQSLHSFPRSPNYHPMFLPCIATSILKCSATAGSAASIHELPSTESGTYARTNAIVATDHGVWLDVVRAHGTRLGPLSHLASRLHPSNLLSLALSKNIGETNIMDHRLQHCTAIHFESSISPKFGTASLWTSVSPVILHFLVSAH